MAGTEVPPVSAALHYVRMPDVAFPIRQVPALDPDVGLAIRGFVVTLFVDIAFAWCRYYLDAFRRRSDSDLDIDDAGVRNAGDSHRTCS
jgi:hypothetical protein